jgi:hypothetical protein
MTKEEYENLKVGDKIKCWSFKKTKFAIYKVGDKGLCIPSDDFPWPPGFAKAFVLGRGFACSDKCELVKQKERSGYYLPSLEGELAEIMAEKSKLKKLNSDGRENCANCNDLIHEPYPGIRYCKRCES